MKIKYRLSYVFTMFASACGSTEMGGDGGVDSSVIDSTATGDASDAGDANSCATPCNGGCCGSGSACVPQGDAEACAALCGSSSECGGGCCAVVSGLQDGGACLPDAAYPEQECICQSGNECANGCCGPAGSGVWLCRPDDGKWLDCCGSTGCEGNNSGLCCVDVEHGDAAAHVCLDPCTTTADCMDAGTAGTCQPATSDPSGTKCGHVTGACY
jgi:hypothetical protein